MPRAPNGRLRRLTAALRGGAEPAIAADAAVSEAEKLKNTERQWNEMFGNEEAVEGDFFTSPDQGKVDGPCALPPLSEHRHSLSESPADPSPTHQR